MLCICCANGSLFDGCTLEETAVGMRMLSTGNNMKIQLVLTR
jgi:hypothetical protein